MSQTSLENFITFGGTKTFVLNLGNRPALELKQDNLSHEDVARQWVDDVWNRSFGATTQAILKTKPFAFSAAGLSDLDMEALRAAAVNTVLAAIEREDFDLNSDEGRQRAFGSAVRITVQTPGRLRQSVLFYAAFRAASWASSRQEWLDTGDVSATGRFPSIVLSKT